jgi:hypothetical protein
VGPTAKQNNKVILVNYTIESSCISHQLLSK